MVLNVLASKVKILIKGINIYEFIKRLNKNNIKTYDIEISSYKECKIIILETDLEKIDKIKSTYEVNVLRYYGLINLKRKLKKSIFILCSLLICSIIVFFLTKIIFRIEIIHSNQELKNFVLEELYKRDIKKYSFQKDYNKLNEIKEDILEKNKTKLEWLEIVLKGNKYIVKVEERIIAEEKKENDFVDVVASKNALIKDIKTESGVQIKFVGEYVKKDEVIVSGKIFLNENLKNIVPAKASVYGEVWYKAIVEQPLSYYEEIYGSKTKNNIELKILNKSFFLFNEKDYQKIDKTYFKVENNLLPFSLSYNRYNNVKVINKVYTIEEAIDAAATKARQKISANLESNEKILSEKILNFSQNDDKINIEIFFSVYENIVSYRKTSMEE